MSISDKITRLQTAKTAIATAITNKGGTVESGHGFESFPADIATIPTGGGQSAYIVVSTVAGALLTCGSQTYQLGADETEHQFSISVLATYTVTVAYLEFNISRTVAVSSYGAYYVKVELPRVPIEYQEVGWLASNSDLYVDTGVLGNAGNNFELKTTVFKSVQSGAEFVFGSRTSEDERFGLIVYGDNFDVGYYGDFSETLAWDLNTWYYVEFNSHSNGVTFVVGSNSYNTTETRELNTGLSVYLFSRNKDGSPGQYYHGRLKEVIINYDGQKVRHFIPCYRKSDSVAGYYDICDSICPLTNSPFYIKSGSGSFVVGGDV